MLKSIRIDVKTREVKVDGIKEEYKVLGGRSLIAQFMMDEVNPQCDPLGPDNKLIFCTTLFAGTGLASANRLHVGGKSPLTGGIKESNAGGMAGTLLVRHGIKMMVLENAGDEWSIIHIKPDGEIAFESADELMGKGSYAVMDILKERYGDGFGAMALGKAGEHQLTGAGICVNEFKSNYPCRLAARGGLGAVMASKKIKAIVMENPTVNHKLEYVDEEVFKDLRTQLNKVIVEAAKTSPQATIGTIANVAASGPTAVLPSYNFSGKIFPEYTQIGPEKFMENIATRGGANHIPCQPGCVLACSNHYNDKNGKHLTSGFEYETAGLCGSNLAIADLDDIARIDRVCDDMGLDTIEMGCALGVAMYEGKIAWGDAEACIELLSKAGEGIDELAVAIGNGAQCVGELLGSAHIPTCKRQGMPAYDPRNTFGTGITYATTAMGADHTTGMTYFGSTAVDKPEMQLYLSRTYQTMLSLPDNFCCLFCWTAVMSRMDLLLGMMKAMYGVELDMQGLMGMSVKMLLTERGWNQMAGFTIEDDAIPQFMHDEPSPFTGNTFDFSSDDMASVYSIL